MTFPEAGVRELPLALEVSARLYSLKGALE
jgi:hypothetical protein